MRTKSAVVKMAAVLEIILLAVSVLTGCRNDAGGAAESVSAEYSEEDSAYDLSGVTGTFTLIVQTHEPEYAVSGTFLNEWAESVEKASGGHIEIDINYGAKLGGAKDTAYMVKNGVADIGWGFQCFYTDRFPVTEVFMLPLRNIESAKQGSEALWEFWNTTDFMDEEYSDYHVLLLHTGCQSPVAVCGEKPETIDDLKGKTIGINSEVLTPFVQALGMLPMNVSDRILYDDFRNQTVDSCVRAWDMLDFLSVDAAVSYYLDEDIGVYTCYLLMNHEAYEEMPEILRQIIDEKSAEAIAYTSVWDEAEKQAKAAVGSRVYQLEDSEKKALVSAADQAAEAWIAAMDGLGYDGRSIYETAMQCIENQDVQ
ncbi:MAG: TRAP transporter substrate-binding protein DctP [Clostridiales bacterium]|nr:TRAP transporter substrate-binding protein DctP [Clostridiales bacterium]